MIKHKLIAATLTSAVVGGTITLLPFKEVNIKPQLDKIHEATNTVNKASTVINNLVNTNKELSGKNTNLSNENDKLSSENDKLQKEIDNNGSLNTNIDYKNLPSMDKTFGNETSKEINKLINYTGIAAYPNARSAYLANIASYYYQTQIHEQMINYYKYLYTSESYCGKLNGASGFELSNRNYEKDQEDLINHLVHGSASSKSSGTLDKMITYLKYSNSEYKKQLSKNPEQVNNMTIPVKDQINMEDIKLPTDFKDKNGNTINLQSKLDKCFEIYTNYCKTHSLYRLANIDSILGQYPNILTNSYLTKYYNYLLNHPELLPKGLNENTVKSEIKKYNTAYLSACTVFNKQLDQLMEKFK